MNNPSDTSRVEKIRALLRKTTAQGCTPAEADAAMQLAQQLMTKWGIDKVVVQSREEHELKPQFEIVKEYHETGRQRYETDEYIARILKQCFSTRVLWSYSFENVESPTKKRWSEAAMDYVPATVMKKRLVYVLVGDKDDVAMAKMIVEELHPIMRHFLNKHLKETQQAWSAVTCHSFFQGLEYGYVAANKRGMNEAMLAAGATDANRYALVVVDKEKATKEFIATKIVTGKSRCLSGGRSGGGDDSAFNSGIRAGKDLNLGRKRIGS